MEVVVLLRFRAENHRSLRDDIELSMVASGTRGTGPADGDWAAATTRVAGVYGANGSGKSTVLDALDFMRRAIAYSATRWGAERSFPYDPFLLDSDSGSLRSSYEVDFVVEGVRYNYGFESDANGIHEEWMHSFPKGRSRMLFERSGAVSPKFSFGRALQGPNTMIGKLVTPYSLFFSAAANNNHPSLGRVYRAVVRGVNYAPYTDHDKQARLSWVKKTIEDDYARGRAEALLAIADIGISKIRIQDRHIDEEFRGRLERVWEAAHEGMSTSALSSGVDQAVEDLRRELQFVHAVDDGAGEATLAIEQESAGTVAWLSIGVPALHCLDKGGVLVVDELDCSLHPKLAAALLSMFKDAEINTGGAQLIFTSHDASLLGPLAGTSLTSDEIWFTEKDRDGVTQLYALHEFSTRASDNFERRYLQGRYGAVPLVDPLEIRDVLTRTAS